MPFTRVTQAETDLAFHPPDKYGALHLLHSLATSNFSCARIFWRKSQSDAPTLNGRRIFQQLEIKGSRALCRSRTSQEPSMEIT